MSQLWCNEWMLLEAPLRTVTAQVTVLNRLDVREDSSGESTSPVYSFQHSSPRCFSCRFLSTYFPDSRNDDSLFLDKRCELQYICRGFHIRPYPTNVVGQLPCATLRQHRPAAVAQHQRPTCATTPPALRGCVLRATAVGVPRRQGCQRV